MKTRKIHAKLSIYLIQINLKKRIKRFFLIFGTISGTMRRYKN